MPQKKPVHELHVASTEHHASVAREALDHVEHLVTPDPSEPLTAATALALCRWAGINTEAEAQAAVVAPPVSADQVENTHKISVLAVGAAFTPDLVARINAGEVRTNAGPLATITEAAARIRLLGAAIAHLRAGAAFLNSAARADADLLDAVVEDVYPQVMALANVDPAATQAWHPLTSYRQHHHKGGGAHPAATPAAPVPAKLV